MFLVQSHLGQEEGRTTIMASPTLKMIGASGLQNTSNTSSRTVCKKYGADKLVQDEGDYAIASQKKFMSHFGQEEGQTIVDTPSRADPGLKKLALRAHRIVPIHHLENSAKSTALISQSMMR